MLDVSTSNKVAEPLLKDPVNIANKMTVISEIPAKIVSSTTTERERLSLTTNRKHMLSDPIESETKKPAYDASILDTTRKRKNDSEGQDENPSKRLSKFLILVAFTPCYIYIHALSLSLETPNSTLCCILTFVSHLLLNYTPSL